MRDQHFSLISRALKNEIFRNKTSLKSAQDVVEALNNNYIYLNEEKISQNNISYISKATYFNPPITRSITKNLRIIQDLDSYYNFQNIKQGDHNRLF